MFSLGTAGLEPPAGARIRKKSKIRGGGICNPRAQNGRVPEFLTTMYIYRVTALMILQKLNIIIRSQILSC